MMLDSAGCNFSLGMSREQFCERAALHYGYTFDLDCNKCKHKFVCLTNLLATVEYEERA